MGFPRAGGVLLHLTSLPGPFGIGDLGSAAYRFADFLVSAGQRLWQMLPVGPAGQGDSPYQSLSVFAGNPLFISPEKLAEQHLLGAEDLDKVPSFSDYSVDFDAVTRFKMPMLKKSFEIFEHHATEQQREEFDGFCQGHVSWLEDYALFMALRESHGLATWSRWDEDSSKRDPVAIENWRRKLFREIRCNKYQQFQFFLQWAELKQYCNQRGIKLIGDVPIFVSLDSSDVWSRPEMFFLDDTGRPTVVAGVPPDYFSATGQLWGNPLYRWDAMAKDGYRWWVGRLRAMCSLFDIIRLDHFRGFDEYWEIPAGARTAVNGRWAPGPGADFFDTLQRELGALPIIAEDLGIITPRVEELRDRFGLPGMRVLQFSFGPDPKTRPFNYPENCVVYTGTHDNNTTIGWFKGESMTTMSHEEWHRERQLVLDYLGTDGHEINWDFIRLALMSAPDTAIIPLQDILGLGGEARMNVPGVNEGNWRWRFREDMLTAYISRRLKMMAAVYGR
ncbi:MAG: 4-alpha-glucanotransferase [Chloroflexi bacterium]|nr:4-alpha-glucanotransferase [Chloroflexota bacterium]